MVSTFSITGGEGEGAGMAGLQEMGGQKYKGACR